MAEIPHGEKTIKMTIAFFTEGLSNDKTCWSTGGIYPITNRSRGIRNDRGHVMFNSLDDIPRKIKELFKLYGISIVRERKVGSEKIKELVQ
jgi:hypothetical protein